MRCWSITRSLLLLTFALGCHREVEMLPLLERTIYTTDRFYDIQALSTDRAVMVGYAGKILETTNGGQTWERLPSGVDSALYTIRFTDAQHAWITGQDGVILHTGDGGKSWQKQESHAVFKDRDGSTQDLYLFGLYAIDNDHA